MDDIEVLKELRSMVADTARPELLHSLDEMIRIEGEYLEFIDELENGNWESVDEFNENQKEKLLED